jgi:uncharacterized protein (TIGR00255 family)
MLKSMTGFGKGESKSGGFHYVIQVKSVNNRFLEVPLKFPAALWPFESEARALFQKTLSRGKVDLNWKETRDSGEAAGVHANLELAQAYKAALENLGSALSLSDPIRLDQVARYPEVITASTSDSDSSAGEAEAKTRWEGFRQALELALKDLNASREREGAQLAVELSERLFKALGLLGQIEKKSVQVSALFGERLKKRLEQALESIPKDDPRLIQEAAIASDKADIREETVRFGLHVTEFERVLRAGGAAGKRLDFLSQELLREANTMGSKSPDAALSHLVVSLKSEIEKIKEQIQNLE